MTHGGGGGGSVYIWVGRSQTATAIADFPTYRELHFKIQKLQKKENHLSKTLKEAWLKRLLGLRSVQISQIHSALKNKLLAGAFSYKSSRMYLFKCLVLNNPKTPKPQDSFCKPI